MTGAPGGRGPVRDRLLVGAGVMMAAVVFSRVLAVGSISVLGRLLTPADFGVVAYAILTLELQRILSGVSFVNALIRLESIDRSHVDTAFTLCFLSNMALAAGLFFGSGALASILAQPELAPVFAWLALVPFIESVKSPRFVLLARELRFGLQATGDVLGRLAIYGTAITLAVLIGNYWAMIAGLIVAAAVGTVLTHVATPGPLGFGLARWRDCLSFGGWTIAHRVTAVANRNLSAPILGATLGLAQLGAFRMGSGIVYQLFERFSQPVDRLIFTGLSARQRSTEDLRRAYYEAQGAVFGLFLPIGVGLALVTPEFLRVLAGTQWSAAVPVLQILAPAMALSLLGAGARGLLNALGSVRAIFFREVLVFVVTLPAVWVGATYYGIAGAAGATAAAQLFGLAVMLPIVARHLEGSVFDSLRLGARSIVASAAMGGAIAALGVAFGPIDVAQTPIGEAARALVSKIACGVVVYVAVHGGLWLLAGRPRGVETIALSILARIWGRIRGLISRRKG